MSTLRDVLRRTYSNLQILEERAAKKGLDTELELLNQIEDHKTAIGLLEAALTTPPSERGLERLKQQLRPLLIATNVEPINLDELHPEKPPLPFEPETVPIPGGSFLMGRDDGDSEESPRHQVNLPEYRLGHFPVTNAQYAEFLARSPDQPVPRKTGWFIRTPPSDKLDHPVVAVSWFDALAYCRWLSEISGRVYRLPTEAEWEKAAAWDGQQSRSFPWGHDFDPERCNAAETGLDNTTPVGRFSPAGDSFFGCVDMAGNVQEWTSTLWGSDLNSSHYPYPYRRDDGREALHVDLYRVFRVYRGGSFRDSADRLRCSARGWSDPDSKIRWRGFRVVLEP